MCDAMGPGTLAHIYEMRDRAFRKQDTNLAHLCMLMELHVLGAVCTKHRGSTKDTFIQYLYIFDILN